ncbi:hypothetical protein F511_36947 [Dorcoceras hygrometricum]|uniref:Uncharacterized protein n=1 Tax=Dorcoceras hygrometricum TaxID=472368 RepID=A0A2Z7AD82_9LAMI|nr:hypothetical protein F511_36947 [Dorcoceras hygrometricum]
MGATHSSQHTAPDAEHGSTCCCPNHEMWELSTPLIVANRSKQGDEGRKAQNSPLGATSSTSSDLPYDSTTSSKQSARTTQGIQSLQKRHRKKGLGKRSPALPLSLQSKLSTTDKSEKIRARLDASAANKEKIFARKMAENQSRPEGLPPSQGGKFVGFGSGPAPPMPKNNSEDDVLSIVSQGFSKLSRVAASAAQSAATVVQVGTKCEGCVKFASSSAFLFLLKLNSSFYGYYVVD